MTEEPVKRCPVCRGKVQRLVGTGAGILFKGSGFYETDYRSDGYKSAANKEKAEPSSKPDKAGTAGKSETSSGGKTESSAKKE